MVVSKDGRFWLVPIPTLTPGQCSDSSLDSDTRGGTVQCPSLVVSFYNITCSAIGSHQEYEMMAIYSLNYKCGTSKCHDNK